MIHRKGDNGLPVTSDIPLGPRTVTSKDPSWHVGRSVPVFSGSRSRLKFHFRTDKPCCWVLTQCHNWGVEVLNPKDGTHSHTFSSRPLTVLTNTLPQILYLSFDEGFDTHSPSVSVTHNRRRFRQRLLKKPFHKERDGRILVWPESRMGRTTSVTTGPLRPGWPYRSVRLRNQPTGVHICNFGSYPHMTYVTGMQRIVTVNLKSNLWLTKPISLRKKIRKFRLPLFCNGKEDLLKSKWPPHLPPRTHTRPVNESV